MKLPEPVGWRHHETGMVTSNAAVKNAFVTVKWDALYTEAQVREALAQQEAAIRQATELLGPQAPECCGCATEWNEAIKALQEALK